MGTGGSIDAPFFRALDALAVDDRGRRTGLACGEFPALHVEFVMDPPERTVPVPATEIVVHRATWWQCLRQRRPLAASAQDIHHAVGDIALGHRALVAAPLRGR